MNTRIDYMYRDPGNYKQFNTIVIQGEVDIDLFKSVLDEELYFIPSQLGLEDLQGRFCNGVQADDHPWHELEEIEHTDDAPVVGSDAGELYRCLMKVEAYGWDLKDAVGV